jgi:hypothetical protein
MTAYIYMPRTSVQLRGGVIDVTCEPTDDPDLVITPDLQLQRQRRGFTGLFALTHEPTGLRIGSPACINCIRQAARNIIALDLDWDADRAPDAPEGAIAEACSPMLRCGTVENHVGPEKVGDPPPADTPQSCPPFPRAFQETRTRNANL